MRITESALRRYIRKVLVEDMETFLQSTKDINVEPSMYGDTDQKKQIKRIWNQQADHNFMKSLVKVHWLAAHAPEDMVQRLNWFLNNSGKDEVSTTAYLPGSRMESSWGTVGVRLEGRATLAANDMNALVTGYAHDFGTYQPEQMAKWKAGSGIPRRPEGFSPRTAGAYMLDADTFNTSSYHPNEVVLDNWRVKDIVVQPKAMKNYLKGRSGYNYNYYRQILQLIKDKGLPVVDNDGNQLDLTELIEYLKTPKPAY